MARTLRMALVLVLATSILVVIPGGAAASVPGGIDRIVFVSDADEPWGEIYVRDFAGSSPIRLTTSPEADHSPRWSPDGTQIAYSHHYVATGGSDVLVMDPDGSNKKFLTNYGPGSASNVPLDWSPDGLRILIKSDRGLQWDLWTIRPDGSDPVRLTNDAAMELTASWSPDGSTIGFGRTTATESDIWLIDADGSNPRNLTNRPREDSSPTWSPDGSRIAWASSFVGDMDIWVMAADGSGAANLTNTPSYRNTEPMWSPDGTKIAFTSNRDGDLDLWMMNSRGSDVGHLTDAPGSESGMDWESVNREPVAKQDEASVRRGRSVEVAPLLNDSDPDGESLVISDITRMPAHGSVVINPSGTVTYTHDGWMPPPGQANIDGFEYEVEDERLASARAEVVVRVSPAFDDVPESNPFVGDITWLAEQGITKGCNPPANTLFCPADPVTRGQMAAFLVRALHYSDGAGADLFVDDNGSVFELDIDKLGTAGVTRGCNPPVNDRFCPGDFVTRGQMAAFLARAFKLTNLGMVDLFVDDDGSIFELDIDKLGATGVSRGCNPPLNDRFCPDQNVTREQMAAFIRRAVDYIT